MKITIYDEKYFNDKYKYIKSRLKDKELNNEHLANEIITLLKEVDNFGYEMEKRSEFKNALTFYNYALKYAYYYKEANYAINKERTLAICHYVLSRVFLKLNDDDNFIDHYSSFLSNSIEAIKNNDEDNEVYYLNVHFRELFIYTISESKELYKGVIDYTSNLFTKIYKDGLIKENSYAILMAQVHFLNIVFDFNRNEDIFKEHTNLIELLFKEYNKDSLIEVINYQLTVLKHASFVGNKYKEIYVNQFNRLTGGTISKTDTVRVFISSVFSDFQKERDLIQDIILPEMKQYALKEFNLKFEIIDLRWGIELDTYLSEEEKMYKVLSICGEMVELAKPYFILFLSDKYGTTVEPELLNYLYPHLNIERKMSITEVEYLLYSQNKDVDDKLLLLLKGSKSNIEDYQLLRFIDNVSKRVKEDNYITYDEADITLANNIITVLKKQIKDDYKDITKINQTNNELIRLGNSFVGREKELNTFKELRNKNIPIITVLGETGTGKSTFLGKIYSDLQQEKIHTFTYLVKDSFNVLYELQFIEFIRKSIESIFNINGIEEVSFKYNIDRLRELLPKLKKEEKVVFIVDDYDYLMFISEPFSWRSDLFHQVTFVLGISDNNLQTKLLMQGAVPVQLLDIKDDFYLYAARKFTDKFKTVRNNTIHRIYVKLNKDNITFNPLYINTLINSLIYINQEDYNNIYKSSDKFNTDFGAALTNYQEKLIWEFPNSFEDLYIYQINKLIKENSNNELLLGLLAFFGNSGVTLKEVNKLLEHINKEYRFTSFLQVKYALADLIELNDVTHIKISNSDFIKVILNYLNKETLKDVSLYILNEYIEDNESLTYINAILYLNKFDFLTQIYKLDNILTNNLILNAIYKYPTVKDKGLEFIDKVKNLSDETLRLMWHLIDNEIESDYTINSKRIIHAKAIIRRLSSLIEEFDNQMYDLYFMAQNYLLKHSNDDKSIELFMKNYNFIKEYMKLFNFQSVYLFKYFVSFFELGLKIDTVDEYLNNFLDVLFDEINNTQIHHADTYLEIYKLLLIVNPGEELYNLEQYERVHEFFFTQEVNEGKIAEQIEQRFFMATQYYFNFKDENKAFYYYERIRELIYSDVFYFPSSSNVLRIYATVTNEVGNYNLSILLWLLKNDKERFINEKEEIDSLIDDTLHFLQKSSFFTQCIVNENLNNTTLYNHLVSNLNYSIFLMSFTNKKDEAINYIKSAYNIMFSNLRRNIVSHTYLIYYLLYFQIFMDYTKNEEIDTIELLNLFTLEANKHRISKERIDLDLIFSLSFSLAESYGIVKSDKYKELEKALKDYVVKFGVNNTEGG